MYLYLECSPKKSVDWQMGSLADGVTLEVSSHEIVHVMCAERYTTNLIPSQSQSQSILPQAVLLN